MKKANLIIGILLFIGFIISGQYMKHSFVPEHIDELTIRMQIRSNHIYLLFIALLNLLSFKCVLSAGHKVLSYIEIAFRCCLIIAGAFAILGFIFEHTGDLDIRIFTFITIVLSLTSIGLVILNELISLKMKRSTQQQEE